MTSLGKKDIKKFSTREVCERSGIFIAEQAERSSEKVHPLDVVTSIFLCADDFLRQVGLFSSHATMK